MTGRSAPRYTESEKARARELWCAGLTYPEIAERIGCSVDTIKCRWSKEWRSRDADLARKVEQKIGRHTDKVVQVDKHQLDHLLALREQYNALKQMIIDTPVNTLEPKDAIAIFRELRETAMASAKLEGVEPPQKVLNVNVNTDAASLKARLRQYEELFSHE